jgi:hypothetical protein
LIRIARRLYAKEPLGVDLSETVYALDSTTIYLCLSLFPWVPFHQTKAAVKLNTLLDLRGAIPTFIHISDGKLHDVKVLDLLVAEPGAFYLMDRGYLDFEQLYTLHQAGSFFVTRAKSNAKFRRHHDNALGVRKVRRGIAQADGDRTLMANIVLQPDHHAVQSCCGQPGDVRRVPHGAVVDCDDEDPFAVRRHKLAEQSARRLDIFVDGRDNDERMPGSTVHGSKCFLMYATAHCYQL